MNNKLADKAIEVSRFLQELAMKHPERYFNAGIPVSDFAYAEALIKWEDDGRNPNSFFSTVYEDAFFIIFAKEISAHFGLDILCKEDAELREQSMLTFRTKVSEEWLLN